MDEVATPKGFGRFAKYIILGSVFGGVSSVIPILQYLNCLFCLLNMTGIVFALSLYLKANPEDMVTNGESVKFGAVAGAGAGLIVGLISALVMAVFGGLGALGALAGGSEAAAEQLAALGIIGVGGAFTCALIPISIALYAAFGALGAFLGMQFFFKARIRKV